jgi:hypothetical protein
MDMRDSHRVVDRMKHCAILFAISNFDLAGRIFVAKRVVLSRAAQRPLIPFADEAFVKTQNVGFSCCKTLSRKQKVLR